MDVVRRYVSRILAFYSGEIISDGPPEKVLADDKVRELVTGHARPAPAEKGSSVA